MRKILIAIALVITFGFLFLRYGKSERRQNAEYRRMSMQEATEYMENEEGYVLLDVRTKEEYESGHIPGAICIPNEEIGLNPPSELQDMEQTILVYCRSGNRSQQAAGKLADIGFKNVIEIGGILQWEGTIEKERE